MTVSGLARALSPLFFAFEGAGMGWSAIYAVELVGPDSSAAAVYLYLVGAAVLSSLLAAATTSRVPRAQSRSALASHLWESALAYLLLFYLLPPSFGGEGAILFAFPASGLLGVILGNAAVTWRSARPPSRQIVP